MPLTDTAIRKTTPREKPFKVFDGAGLFLLVNPNGSKLWRYKFRFAGKEKLLSFGPYPLVSLKQARQKRDEARLQKLDGTDPAAARKQARLDAERAKAITFNSVAQEFLEKREREGASPATMKKLRWFISLTGKRLDQMPVSEISAPDVLQVLRQVEARGTYETCNRLRGTISSVMRYAIATGRAKQDPTEALKGALIQPRVRSRSAIIDRRELGQLQQDVDGYRGQPTVRYALRLLAILAPRPGELRQAEWREFDFENREWRIPAERMKMRRPHRVPLPEQALTLLRELRQITGSAALLFPSARSWKKPISDNTLNQALRRLGYGPERITAHGFRATFSTFANESGLWHPDAVERALAHVEANDVRRAYLRGEHWEEREKMASWWAAELDQMRELVCSPNEQNSR